MPQSGHELVDLPILGRGKQKGKGDNQGKCGDGKDDKKAEGENGKGKDNAKATEYFAGSCHAKLVSHEEGLLVEQKRERHSISVNREHGCQ